ncbi:MAG: hypothetical protein OIF32_08135 [Campylobacterales bacterium]|nr:hypothetical protein [Campylobacterales bacterium]
MKVVLLFLFIAIGVYSNESNFQMSYGNIIKGDYKSTGGNFLVRSRNSKHYMKYLDLDKDRKTRNSSYGYLNLKKNRKILFAKLYWWSGVNDMIAGEESLQIKLPKDKKYRTIYADEIYKDKYYALAQKDITKEMKKFYKGRIWASNRDLKEGLHRLGGWTLVVVYEDKRQPNKEIIIHDGLEMVTRYNEVKIDFKKHSRINQKIAIGSFGGNRYSRGDSLFFNEKRVRRLGRKDNIFIGRGFKKNGIAMDYFSKKTEIYEDDIQVLFKSKKDTHLPFLLIYSNTIVEEEIDLYLYNDIADVGNIKLVEVTANFETKSGRKEEIENLNFKAYTPKYADVDRQSFVLGVETVLPKKIKNGYSVYLGDKPQGKVSYRLNVPKYKTPKEIEKDIKNCFEYNYIYKRNKKIRCIDKAMTNENNQISHWYKETKNYEKPQKKINKSFSSRSKIQKQNKKQTAYYKTEDKESAVFQESIKKADLNQGEFYHGLYLGSSISKLTADWSLSPIPKETPSVSPTTSFSTQFEYRTKSFRVIGSLGYHLWGNGDYTTYSGKGDYIFPSNFFKGRVFVGTEVGQGTFTTDLTKSKGSGVFYGGSIGYIKSINKKYELEFGGKHLVTSGEAKEEGVTYHHSVNLESLTNFYVGFNIRL